MPETRLAMSALIRIAVIGLACLEKIELRHTNEKVEARP